MANVSAVLLALLSALVLMTTHLFSHRIYRFSANHKNRMISFFGGIAVAYVFLELLPRLEATHIHLETVFGDLPAFLDTIAVPSLALIGFLIFFGLEHLAIRSRRSEREKMQGDYDSTIASVPTFIAHLAVLVFFNLVIGYVLRFEVEIGVLPLLLYTSALSLHFIILDNTMESHYKRLYLKYGRYAASFMPLIGWGLSVFFPESPSVGYLLLAFLYGVILFNAIKDEVPKEGGKSSGLFIAGALFYAILLFLIAWLSN